MRVAIKASLYKHDDALLAELAEEGNPALGEINAGKFLAFLCNFLYKKVMMKPISYSHLRNNLAAALDQVTNDHVPLLITRDRGKPAAVLMSLEDYASISETQYLTRSPSNASALQQSLEQLDNGEIAIYEFNDAGRLEPVNEGHLHKKCAG